MTVTVTDAETGVVPAAPVAVIVYVKVPVAVGVTEMVPLHGSVPERLPDPAQLVAFVVVTVSVMLWPRVIVLALAANVAVGGAGVTVTVTGADVVVPPAPDAVPV